MIPDAPFTTPLRLLIAAAVLALLAGCGTAGEILIDPMGGLSEPPAGARLVEPESFTAAAACNPGTPRPQFESYGRLWGGRLNVDALLSGPRDPRCLTSADIVQAAGGAYPLAQQCAQHSPDVQLLLERREGHAVPAWLAEVCWRQSCFVGQSTGQVPSKFCGINMLQVLEGCPGPSQWDPDTAELSPTGAFGCRYWTAAVDPRSGAYRNCSSPSFLAAIASLCGDSNPCPGWNPWPPTEGAEACDWTPAIMPESCGWYAAPLSSGIRCNARYRVDEPDEPDEPNEPDEPDDPTSPATCDLSPVTDELVRLREALADLPAPICPEPVCHPAPCRLDCDCPSPCPDVICGDGGGGEPDEPDPGPVGQSVDITADFLANNRKRTVPVPWSASLVHVRVDANSSSRVDQQPTYPVSPAQVVFGCLRPAPDPKRGKGLCIIRQPDKRGARLDNGQNVSCGGEGGWQIDHRDGTISERCGRSLTYQATLAVVDDLAVDLSLDPKFETDGSGNPTAWFVPRSGNIRFRLTPVAQQRRGLVAEEEPFELPYVLWGVRWGEGVEP